MSNNTESLATKDCFHSINLVNEIDLSWVDFLPSGAIVVASIITAIWAYKTIKSHETIAKKRSTMDFIMVRSRDRKFFACWAFMRQAHEADTIDIKLFANAKKDIKLEHFYDLDGNPMDCKKARNLICYMLNQYEYMATGIYAGIYDKELLSNSSKTSTVKAYEMTRPYIDQIKIETPRSYANFVKLATEWSSPI